MVIVIVFLLYSVWDKYMLLFIFSEFLKFFVGNEEVGVMFFIFFWVVYLIVGMVFGCFLK